MSALAPSGADSAFNEEQKHGSAVNSQLSPSVTYYLVFAQCC